MSAGIYPEIIQETSRLSLVDDKIISSLYEHFAVRGQGGTQ